MIPSYSPSDSRLSQMHKSWLSLRPSLRQEISQKIPLVALTFIVAVGLLVGTIILSAYVKANVSNLLLREGVKIGLPVVTAASLLGGAILITVIARWKKVISPQEVRRALKAGDTETAIRGFFQGGKGRKDCVFDEEPRADLMKPGPKGGFVFKEIDELIAEGNLEGLELYLKANGEAFVEKVPVYWHACSHNKPEAVELLLKHCLQYGNKWLLATPPVEERIFPIQVAMEKGFLEVVKLLAPHHKESLLRLVAFISMARVKEPEILRILVNAGIDLNATREDNPPDCLAKFSVLPSIASNPVMLCAAINQGADFRYQMREGQFFWNWERGDPAEELFTALRSLKPEKIEEILAFQNWQTKEGEWESFVPNIPYFILGLAMSRKEDQTKILQQAPSFDQRQVAAIRGALRALGGGEHLKTLLQLPPIVSIPFLAEMPIEEMRNFDFPEMLKTYRDQKDALEKSRALSYKDEEDKCHHLKESFKQAVTLNRALRLWLDPEVKEKLTEVNPEFLEKITEIQEAVKGLVGDLYQEYAQLNNRLTSKRSSKEEDRDVFAFLEPTLRPGYSDLEWKELWNADLWKKISAAGLESAFDARLIGLSDNFMSIENLKDWLRQEEEKINEIAVLLKGRGQPIKAIEAFLESSKKCTTWTTEIKLALYRQYIRCMAAILQGYLAQPKVTETLDGVSLSQWLTLKIEPQTIKEWMDARPQSYAQFFQLEKLFASESSLEKALEQVKLRLDKG